MRAAANFSCGHIVFFLLKAPSTLTSRLADPVIFLVDPCDLSGSNSSGQPADRRIYNCKKWPVEKIQDISKTGRLSRLHCTQERIPYDASF